MASDSATLFRVALAMIEEILFNPPDIGVFVLTAVVLVADFFPHLVEQFGRLI